MQRDLIAKGRTLGGSSDLTLLAPIKPGFIDSLESVTYKTRVKRVLAALHAGRQTGVEYAAARLLSDAVERVGAIQSVRVAVLEPEDKVLLVVTFDGNWESYIRVLWDKVGTLLDVIFCSTVDYVPAFGSSFDEWHGWAQRVQVESSFFYGPPDFTSRDTFHHRRNERMRQRGEGCELNELRSVAPSAEEAVQRTVHPLGDPPKDDFPVFFPPNYLRTGQERLRGGLQSLAGLYRLTDLFRPSTPDGEVLRMAAIDLLLEFVQMWDTSKDQINKAKAGRFARQIDWLFPAGTVVGPNVRKRPPDAATQPDKVDACVLADIQGGIVRGYAELTHGVALLLAFENAQAASLFLAWLENNVSHGNTTTIATPAQPACNAAFTSSGLRAMGMDEDTLALFPEEFRQGMAARAGLLGDVRNNHPRRWRLPQRLVDLDTPLSALRAGHELIEMDAVHAVVQFRCKADANVSLDLAITDTAHPLKAICKQMLSKVPGITLLSAQTMVRRYLNGSTTKVKELFGYVDGAGQPDVEQPTGLPPNEANRIHLGEIVHGHANAADDAPDLGDPHMPATAKNRLTWLNNGSFLVLRKYRQFVSSLENAVKQTDKDMVNVLGGKAGDYLEIIYAKLMGRHRDGTPLVAHAGENQFNYRNDWQGSLCPLHAHVRLAHPRADKSSAARIPRIMRRGMSYGPAAGLGADGREIDHGIMFMAYNADISEQFETVQRWLAGGNSTGSTSSESCPILGVPENGFPRHFRFEYADNKKVPHVFRVQMETPTPLFEDPAAVTQLDWGLYLFAPSFGVMGKLKAVAAGAAAMSNTPPVPWQVERGRKLIDSMKQIEFTQGFCAAAQAWKALIEDPESIDRLDSASAWAAIRQDCGGVLKTPYGTLVADRDMAANIFLDSDEKYSVSGQFERMKKSFGEISLGLDKGPRYDMESTQINQAIMDLTKDDAGKQRIFDIAFNAANQKINKISAEAKESAEEVGALRYDVSFDAREVADEVLADLSEEWFGLRNGLHLRRGSPDWAWKDGDLPLYPGHFTAMSRYMFQPNPGPTAVELGERYGQALRVAVNKFVAHHRTNNTLPESLAAGVDAPIAAATFKHPQLGSDNDWVARNMVGVLMGFNPTIIGAILNILREWQRDGSFNTLRTALAGRTDRASARQIILRPMAEAAQMRPMPQIAWRTARKEHGLGPAGACPVQVATGDKVVLGLVSGTQQSLEDGGYDERLMFGGVRKAAAPHPTHACPGYEAAIEALLGTLAAFLSRPEKMLPGIAPLSFVLVWRCDTAKAKAAQLEALAWRAVPPKKPLPTKPQTRTGHVVVIGDSWVDSPYKLPIPTPRGLDMGDFLADFGYSVVNNPNDPNVLCHYERWGTAEILKSRIAKLTESVERQIGGLPTGVLPTAILISAGGNDSTGVTFDAMLRINDHDSNTPALNLKLLGDHIALLMTHYRAVLSAVNQTVKVKLGRELPIIVHGYDHPIPNTRLIDRKWFRYYLNEKLYREDIPADQKKADAALVEIINQFNTGLSVVAGEAAFKSFVHHINLTGTIAEYWTKPQDGWRDNLHPVNEASYIFATKIDELIESL